MLLSKAPLQRINSIAILFIIIPMEGHFITIHDQELVGIAQGIKVMMGIGSSMFLFLPLVIFVLGISLTIWAYRLSEDERNLGDFFKWLITSLVLIGLVFGPVFGVKQTYTIVLNPIVLKDGEFLLRTVGDVGKEAQKLSDTQVRVNLEGPPIVGLLVIPDRVATLISSILDTSIATTVFGTKADINAKFCQDPVAIGLMSHTLLFSGAFGLHKEGEEKVDWQDYKNRLESYSTCLERKFGGGFAFRDSWDVDFGATGGVAGTTAVAFSVMCASSGVGLALSPLCGVAGGLAAGLLVYGLERMKWSGCGDIKSAGEKIIDNTLSRCVEKGYLKSEDKDKVSSMAKACFLGQGDSKCGDYINSLAQNVRNASAMSGSIGTGTEGSIKNFLSQGLATAASGWTNATYFSFNTKIEMLAKAQGVALSLLMSSFPFVILLSLIPTGRSWINYSLIISVMVSYFLVRLWLIVAGIVVNFALSRFAII